MPSGLMGLAIGSNGINIRQARGIAGVLDIQLEEQGEEQPCLIKVYSETPDSARQVRFLNFVLLGDLQFATFFRRGTCWNSPSKLIPFHATWSAKLSAKMAK